MIFRTTKKTYPFLNAGALGDVIHTLPVLNKLFERRLIEKIVLHPRFIDLFKLFFPESILFDSSKTKKAKNDKGEDIQILDFEANKDAIIMYLNSVIDTHVTSLSIHLTDIASINLAAKVLSLKDKSLPLIDASLLPEYKVDSNKYIVVAYGYQIESRKMREDSFDALKKHAKSLGYDIVLLGNTKHFVTGSSGLSVSPKFDIDTDGCINLINKTSLPEALSVLNNSCGIIGLDNGLLHLAGVTDIPIVMGFTTVEPEFRLPYRHGELGWKCFSFGPTKGCKYCQTDNYINIDINYSTCPSNTFECIKTLSNDDWVKGIDYINSQHQNT